MTRSTLVLFFVAGFAAPMVGCSEGGPGRPNIVPVTGVVKYKGQPVQGAVVTFMSEGSPRTASGLTDGQGRFELSTYDTADGAPVGEHTVTISKTEPASAEAKEVDSKGYAGMMAAGKAKRGMPEMAERKQVLPTKYADPKQSGLKRQVIEGDRNHFEFDLTD